MSRFHRDTFHPARADLAPPPPERTRKRHGKRSGHEPPPWVAHPEQAEAARPLELRREPPAVRTRTKTATPRRRKGGS